MTDALESWTVDSLMKFNEVFEIIFTEESYTKVGPVGTTQLIRHPVPAASIQRFADKHGMTMKVAAGLFAFLDSDDEAVEILAGLLDYLAKGAKAANTDLRSYAEQYFKGVDAPISRA